MFHMPDNFSYPTCVGTVGVRYKVLVYVLYMYVPNYTFFLVEIFSDGTCPKMSYLNIAPLRKCFSIKIFSHSDI